MQGAPIEPGKLGQNRALTLGNLQRRWLLLTVSLLCHVMNVGENRGGVTSLQIQVKARDTT